MLKENIMVNANEFGFMPGNKSSDNRVAFQRLLDQEGSIRIEKPGIYDIDDTLYISSNTELIFGHKVYLRRTGQRGYVFLNKGAKTKEYDENITITGLNLMCNGFNSKEGDLVLGLRGQICFFYAKNIVIRDFKCKDLMEYSFCFQFCTFENLLMENILVYGLKDGIHLSKGDKFTIRHCIFKTFDDPIALNAHNYVSAAAELGDITNGLIEDCYDLAQDKTVGYFCRLLAGSWCHWFENMEVQQGDAVIHNDRIYRVNMTHDKKTYISKTPPSHEEGTVEHDGILWVMLQDREVVESCAVKNVTFRNIFLQKERHTAFSFTYDKNEYSRSYYPNSKATASENISFENIYVQNKIEDLIGIRTLANNIKLTNSYIGSSKINLRHVETPGIEYEDTFVTLSNVTLKGEDGQLLIKVAPGRKAYVNINGTSFEDKIFKPSTQGDAVILNNDLGL